MEAITDRFADGEALRDSHKGEECIIIGNGPSLKEVPLAFLKSYPTFASNYIYLLGDFNPTYFTVGSYNVFNKAKYRAWIRPTIRASKASFLSKYGAHHFPYPNVFPINKTRAMVFSLAPHKWIHLGSNSTFTNLQYAFFMGFHKVFLVGVDHDYSGLHTGEHNHFSRDYPTIGSLRPILANPKSHRTINAGFLAACRTYELAGREVINLNPDSKLPFFPKGRPTYAVYSGNAA